MLPPNPIHPYPKTVQIWPEMTLNGVQTYGTFMYEGAYPSFWCYHILDYLYIPGEGPTCPEVIEEGQLIAYRKSTSKKPHIYEKNYTIWAILST